MDILMVILRVVHVFSGIAWVGSTFFLFFYLTPTVQKLGADGGKVMRVLLLDSTYALVIPAAAVLTALSGLWMFARVADGDYLRSASGIVLSVGALFGLGAAGHGLGVILPTIRRLQKLLGEMAGPPSEEQRGTLQGLQRKMATNTRIIFVLMVISVLGMSSFRYF